LIQDDVDIEFTCSAKATSMKVALYHGGVVTHSLDMGQQMLYLNTVGFHAGSPTQKVTASMTGDANLTPPGPYIVYIVVDGIPGAGQPITILADNRAIITDSLGETKISYNAAPETTNLPRIIPPDAQTAHVERPQGGISPPNLLERAQTEHNSPTPPPEPSPTKQNTASPNLPTSAIPSTHERLKIPRPQPQTARMAQNNGQDLTIAEPGDGHPPPAPVQAEHAVAIASPTSTLITNPVAGPSTHERLKIPRPQPQTARMAQNNGQDLTVAEPGDGHPPPAPVQAEHAVAISSPTSTLATIPILSNHERFKFPRPSPQTARVAQIGQGLSGPQPGDGHPPALVDRRDEAGLFESSATESDANRVHRFFASALMTAVVGLAFV
jgi:hypothetical protein